MCSGGVSEPVLGPCASVLLLVVVSVVESGLEWKSYSEILHYSPTERAEVTAR